MSFKNLTNTVIPYFTLGDPSVSATEQLIRGCFDVGVALIEVGIPFSDPIADGPVIQASHTRALGTGEDVSISAGLAMVKRLKIDYSNQIVFMMSVNLIIAMGPARFFDLAKDAGLDGVVIPDLPIEESTDYLEFGREYNVKVNLLVSPLCESSRLKRIVASTQGFLYVISTMGTTGARSSIASGLKQFVSDIRSIKASTPVAVGFGISSADHVQEVLSYADAAIVGSHLVNILHDAGVEKTLEVVKTLLAKQ